MKTQANEVDLAMAAAFLARLDPGGMFTFQTFAERQDSKESPGRFACVLHGTFDQHSAQLVRLNNSGAGVFVMVNEGDGVTHDGSKTCRTLKNVIRVRALFVDLDGAPFKPLFAGAQPTHPDIFVRSSAKGWHAYWLVKGCPLDEFKARQLQLAEKFGGDKAVSDLPRVMRLPGFFHLKGAPFMTKLTDSEVA